MAAMRELPNLTLPQMLRENARTMPERIALRQKDFGIWLPISWAEYDRRARHFGLGLRALGLAEGGHVGILSENRAEWVVAQLGAGMVSAGRDRRLRDQPGQ
jgi:long-chain acyl-CoA synthetase